jgi:phosphatidate cytidylyltransferase
VILSGLCGLLVLDYHVPLGAPGVWLLPLAVLVSVLMVRELLDLWSARPDRPMGWPVYLASPLTVLAAALPLAWPLRGLDYPPDCPLGMLGWPLLALTGGIFLAFVDQMRRYTRPGYATGSIALSVLAIVYAGWLPSFLVTLRLFNGPRWGMAALLSLIVIVKLSDTGAYFVGRRFGKHKLAPLLSPGKTIEGTVGGLAAAGAGAWICCAWLVPLVVGRDAAAGPAWGWLLYGLVITLCGMVGDLAESLLKRDAQCKDSSSWLPGLGGVLDLLDSLVFAAPAGYFFFTTGLIGPGH